MSMELGVAGGTGAGEFMLFGVRVVVDSMRKSVSLNNLSQYEHRLDSSSSNNINNDKDVGAGYASADEAVPNSSSAAVAVSSGGRDRKRGIPWTEEEHKLFLIGLQKVGKGDWRGIARNFVKTRTPTQVASHAQKYFLRRSNLNRRRRRSSLFDITTDTVAADPTNDQQIFKDNNWITVKAIDRNKLRATNLVEIKGKGIKTNEYKQDYSSELLEIINAFPRRFGYDLVSQHRDLTSIWERVEAEHIVAGCLNCMAYCCLFPEGFAIEGDELVQLWMAAGLIEQEPMEVFAAAYLSIIQDLGGGFISLTKEDNMNGEKWYILNDAVKALPTTNAEDHSHELVRDRPLNLDSVSSFSQIRTLLLLKGHRSSHIDRLPYGFFMSLELLQALDLSGTKLSELPSSIGGAKFLRYLSLSETLIQRLPETICCLPNLQTLKLRNCPRLLALPKAMSRVTSLQHLDLGTLCDLCCMPPQMGSLTRLYTLSNFIVAREFGCGVGELKNLNNLKGRICLSRLENVGNVNEAEEAQLLYKQNITKLELRWTDSSEWHNVEGDNCEEEEVIQHLQPPKELQHLEIICYGGSKFPTWISLPWFDKLTSIVLFKCENCQLLPSLGQLPSLESVTLIELVQVKIIDLSFCVETTTPYKDDFVAFPKLQRLEIKSMLSLEEWRDMGEVQYFPSLTDLVIKDCPQLVTLCRLSQVCCLKYLEIKCCGRLPSLPEGGLPDSVETFVIDDCPLLYLSCNKSMDEQGWHKTEHDSSLLVYHHVRSCLSTSQETSTTSAS